MLPPLYRRNTTIMSSYFMMVVSVLLLLTACKKELPPPPPDPEPTEPTVTRTDDEKFKDEVYHYYKLYSLWTESIEPADPISSFTDGFEYVEDLFVNLRNQTPFHHFYYEYYNLYQPPYEGYNGAIDRFSHIDFISSGSNSARADNADGYGIFTTVLWDGTSTVGHIHTFFVEGGSPAEKAGVKRGDRLVSVNGRTNLEVPISGGRVTNASNIDFVADALEGNRLELEVERTDGTRHGYSLDYKTYPIDPLLMDTVYTRGSKKIGYLALSSFEDLYTDGDAPTQLWNDLEMVFSKFEEEHIDDLILDFRYNIGGYMYTADYLANKIINADGDGKLMYQYETNDYLKSRASGMSREFSDVYYEKNNNLNIRNLYFLVTENTASASEILISVTKPYFDHVEIIAETDRTFGKPVGYFPQDIMGKADLWVASFKAYHPDGYSEYWDGIPATKTDVLDNILRDYGDPEESMIAEALSHVTTGAYRTSDQQARIARSSQSRSNAKKIIDINKLKPRNLIKK